MRIRSLKPAFFEDEKLAKLQLDYRVLFAGLWCLGDSEGRLENRPEFIKIKIFPYDAYDVVAGIKALADRGFLTAYETNGRGYLQINNFLKHQRISGNEAATKSEFPAPPKTNSGSTLEALGKHFGSTLEAVNVQEGKGKEGKGDTDLSPASPRDVSVASASPPESGGNGRNGDSVGARNGASEGTRDVRGPSVEDLVALWNEKASPHLPRVRYVSEAIRKMAAARLSSHPDAGFWAGVVSKVNSSPFLSGQEGSWRATFDWIIRPTNLSKILNGNYDREPVRH
jgi:hypothetical protein